MSAFFLPNPAPNDGDDLNLAADSTREHALKHSEGWGRPHKIEHIDIDVYMSIL